MRINVLTVLVLLLVVSGLGQLSSGQAQETKDEQLPKKTTAHPLNGVFAVPMRMNYSALATALPIVYCRINGGKPQPFLFDTGYSGTILLDEGEARILGLTMTDSNIVTRDVNGVARRIKVAQVKSVEGLTTHNTYFDANTTQVYVTNIPLNNERVYPAPMVGIIGLDMFWGATLYFDFAQQVLQIIPGEHPDVALAEGAFSVPFDYDGKRLKVDATSLLGVRGEMGLDTGAVKSYLSRSALQKLQPAATYDGFAPGAFDSFAPAKLYQLSALPFHGMTLRNLMVCEALDQRTILGMDILSQFRVTIDVRREKIVLEPTRALLTNTGKEPAKSGLTLTRRAGDIYVSGAVSPYENLIGCQLIDIGEPLYKGKALRTFPLAQIQALLDGYTGTSATIIVRAQGKDKTVTIKRRTVPEMYNAIHEQKRL